MNYILLDLEWDCFYCKSVGGFENEILEFGAVKLDSSFNMIDEFRRIVRSGISKKLSGRFKRLTSMTNEDMLSGDNFIFVLNDYKKWAGKDNITLSWSDTDLHVLYRNCEIFTGNTDNAKIGKYADLQKIFHSELARQGRPEKKQMSLSGAADTLGISYDDNALHHAEFDSELSALIFKRCYREDNFMSFVKDTDNDLFYHSLMFKNYYIHDLNSSFVDKSMLNTAYCPECKRPIKRTTKWKFKGRNFIAEFKCGRCNKKYLSKVCFKRLFDSTVVKKSLIEIKDTDTNNENTNIEVV